VNVTAVFGAAALLSALSTSLFATGASVYGLRHGSRAAILAGRRAVFATAALVTLAAGALLYALMTDDFSIAQVAAVSSSELEPLMKWSALYTGQPGALIFWTWLTSIFMAAFVVVTVPRIPWGAPHAVAAAGAILSAFLIALVFFASPFQISPITPEDGRGLNPLLVDPGMLIHPPLLVAGMVSTAVPFVLGAAALMSGKVDRAWIRHARGWALLSFLVLSAGNFAGSWWAYTVLGWGGYWGWDPVENSSLLPMLPMVAFLHTVMVQERRGMMKLWNLILVFAAFALAVFGTFNVRSGLITSVHSFVESALGPYFLLLVGLTLIGSVALLVWRMASLRGEHDFDSLLSREATMIVNSYVMIAITVIVLGGTLFPIFSELLAGTRITVGPHFYSQVVGPLLIAMLVLMVLGTVFPWRRAARDTLVRRLTMPVVMLAASWVALSVLGMRDPFALTGVSLAIVLIYVTVREYVVAARGLRRATNRGWPSSFASLLERDQRRWGGYLVHLGVAVIAIAVVSSTVYQEQVRATVAPGASFRVGDYVLTYGGLSERTPGVNGIATEVVANVSISEGGEAAGVLFPGKRYFAGYPEQPASMVAIDGDLQEDLYVFLQGWDDTEVAVFQAFVNPLMQWLWIGGAVYLIGGLAALLPGQQPVPVRRGSPISGAQPGA
jgi:cytochrome c-type biogenesis protein CcmF